MYFSISLGLGHKGFHRKLHLTTLLFNLYLGSILRNTYLPLKLCISLGNLYIYMYIETERCTVLHFDINVVRYFLFTCSGKTSDYNIKFWYVFLVICSEFCQYRMIFHKNVRLTSVCMYIKHEIAGSLVREVWRPAKSVFVGFIYSVMSSHTV